MKFFLGHPVCAWEIEKRELTPLNYQPVSGKHIKTDKKNLMQTIFRGIALIQPHAPVFKSLPDTVMKKYGLSI